MSRGPNSNYISYNNGFTISPQTQVYSAPSTAQNYSTSGYGQANAIGGTPIQTAGGMLSAGTNYTGYVDSGSAATARSPEQINNLVTPEERVSLESEWSVDPFEFDASSGVDYVTAFQDWELDRDYNEGGLRLAKGVQSIGGTPETVAQRVLATAKWDKTPEQQYDLAKDMSAYFGGKQGKNLNSQLLSAGYTAEELTELGVGSYVNPDNFVNEEGFFDYNAWYTEHKNAALNQTDNYFGLYDDKILETKANVANNLNTLRSTDYNEFVSQYSNSSVSDKNSYLYSQLEAGEINNDEYKQNVISNLAKEGRKVVAVGDKYYYYEPKEGSADTSYKIDGSEQYYEVNFTPEKFSSDSVARLESPGQGMFGLKSDNTADKIITGDDDLGQLLYNAFSTGSELTGEAKKKHQEASFLAHGIGSRGKAVNPFKDKLRNEFLTVARVGAAIATGGTSEVYLTLGKAASGETLTSTDYLTLAMPALETAGLLVPPTQGVQGSGQGVLGLSYNASEALITGAIAGDPVEAVATAYGPKLVNQALEKAGVGDALNTFASNNNINADDLNAGINKTIKSLAQGDDIEDAVLKGVGKYVTEGGTILPDVIEDAIGDAAKKVGDLVEPVTKALSTINDNLIKPVTKEVGGLLSGADTATRQALSALDDNVIQPLTESAGDALSAADTAVRQGLATFDEEVLQPVTQPLGDALEDAAQATGDVVEDVGQAVGDVAEDVGQAVGDVAEDVGQVTGDVVEDVAQVTGDVLSNADTVARDVLSEVDDAVINPAGDIIEDVAQATGDVIEDVGQVIGDVAEDVGQEVRDALSAAETAVRQALEEIDLPEIDIDLPEIDLNLPALDLNIPQVTSAPSATRTTGGLFDVSQFKHDKGISLIGNLLTGLTEQDANKLSKKQYQQPKEEVVDLLSDPFANAFNYKV